MCKRGTGWRPSSIYKRTKSGWPRIWAFCRMRKCSSAFGAFWLRDVLAYGRILPMQPRMAYLESLHIRADLAHVQAQGPGVQPVFRLQIRRHVFKKFFVRGMPRVVKILERIGKRVPLIPVQRPDQAVVVALMRQIVRRKRVQKGRQEYQGADRYWRSTSHRITVASLSECSSR